ncbi:DUF1232 domain-containing protein [Brachyspira pilosicoli]|uniref:DUF1232 domain-containing protein n=1 Tax=Brachyspira pilosicoli TaxID=52584 RepID=UPI002542DB90|nr:DUF1232 domain-containing protein [Brachyspira pilosicoli]WIH80320.1 DUF1232 domain-containing protein [Brachyspira pilosicoli]
MLSLFNKDDEVIKSKDGVFDKYHHIIAWIPFVASVFYCTSPLDIVSDILPLSGRIDEGFLLVATILHGIQNGVFCTYPKIRRTIKIIKYIVIIVGIIFMLGLFGHLMINSNQMP